MVYSWIIGSLRDHQRRLDLAGGGKRRTLYQKAFAFRCSGIPHALVEHLADGLPVRRYGIQQRDQIGGTEQVDRCRIKIGSKSYACECGITAIRSTKDANALGISNAFSHQVLYTPGDVILHLLAPLFVAGVDEFFAIAR